EVVLVGEALVAGRVVRRDADDGDAGGEEGAVVVAEVARLLRAAGRVVGRVEVEGDGTIPEVGEAEGLAGLRRPLEVGGEVAGLGQLGHGRGRVGGQPPTPYGGAGDHARLARG